MPAAAIVVATKVAVPGTYTVRLESMKSAWVLAAPVVHGPASTMWQPTTWLSKFETVALPVSVVHEVHFPLRDSCVRVAR